MKNYKVYTGFLSKDAQEEAIKLFIRMGWLPPADENNIPYFDKNDDNCFQAWPLIVPEEDVSLLWFLEESAIMEIWEEK